MRTTVDLTDGQRAELLRLAAKRGLKDFSQIEQEAVDASRLHRSCKWNKIEHRLFSLISQNWRGKPLVSHEVIVNLIAGTSTGAGLRVRSELDTNKYPAGRKVTNKELDDVLITRDKFHGD